MRKAIIINIIIAIVSIVGVLYLYGFHFSRTYLIGRHVPMHRLTKLNADWKNAGCNMGPGGDFIEFPDDGRKYKIGDTVYIGNRKAVLQSLTHRLFIDYELILERIPDGEECCYISK